MDRRNFLKQASGYALAAAGTMTGIGQVFASAMPAKEDRTNGYSDNLKQNKDMEHRNLGGMEVSAIGLGCLPMEVTLEDYNNGTEKIFYPDPELSLDDTPRGLPGTLRFTSRGAMSPSSAVTGRRAIRSLKSDISTAMASACCKGRRV